MQTLTYLQYLEEKFTIKDIMNTLSVFIVKKKED